MTTPARQLTPDAGWSFDVWICVGTQFLPLRIIGGTGATRADADRAAIAELHAAIDVLRQEAL